MGTLLKIILKKPLSDNKIEKNIYTILRRKTDKIMNSDTSFFSSSQEPSMDLSTSPIPFAVPPICIDMVSEQYVQNVNNYYGWPTNYQKKESNDNTPVSSQLSNEDNFRYNWLLETCDECLLN